MAARPIINWRSSGIFAGAARSQVGDPSPFIQDVAERSVETGPAFRPDLVLQSRADFLLAPRAQFQCNPFRRTAAKSLAYVVAADDQVLAVVGAAADEHVDMGVVGVPMIHCDPVEARSEVALRVLHELAREGTKVGKLARVFRRDCEPEMMPVLFAALHESFGVGVVGGVVEHPGVRAVACDALALEVGDMLRERN